mgnify:CR=1 FL=1
MTDAKPTSKSQLTAATSHARAETLERTMDMMDAMEHKAGARLPAVREHLERALAAARNDASVDD